jgi:hypothetical protein
MDGKVSEIKGYQVTVQETSPNNVYTNLNDIELQI